MKTGGCLCGAVTYRVNGPLRPVVACHCGQCRKASGNYVAATSALREQVEITGTPQWYASSETARRGFCPTCGAFLFWKDTKDPHISFSLGAIEGPTGLKLEKHIFVADKGDYYQIADGVRQEEN